VQYVYLNAGAGAFGALLDQNHGSAYLIHPKSGFMRRMSPQGFAWTVEIVYWQEIWLTAVQTIKGS
jgi:hypothetical protein